MIERVLRGAEGGRRTALLVALAGTTWGFGIVSLAAGWQAGLIALVVGIVVVGVLRSGTTASALPARATVTDADGGGTDADSPGATAEERVLARLSKMREAEAAEG